jgi:hypothetical protein
LYTYFLAAGSGSEIEQSAEEKEDDPPPSQTGQKQVSVQPGPHPLALLASLPYWLCLALQGSRLEACISGLHTEIRPAAELIGLSEIAVFTEAVERPSKYKLPEALSHLASTIVQREHWFPSLTFEKIGIQKNLFT